MLAKDMIAGFDNPPFDRSPVDGYACKAEDIMDASESHPVQLTVLEEIDAGQYSRVTVENGSAEVKMSEKKKENLEEMFKDLEELIGKMENEEITLEQTFDLYNNGMELLKKCNLYIDEVEKKVLVLDENGETDEF